MKAGGTVTVVPGFLLALLLLAACGLQCDTLAPATLPRATFAYVANILDGTISIYAQDVASGQWRSRGYVVATGLQPYSVATHPTGKFAYVTADGSASVAAYAIDATTGLLTLVNNSATGTNPQSIAISPSGNFAYVANRNIGGTGSVSAYAIDTATGALSPIDSDPAGGEPHSVTLDPSGRFAYTANFTTHDISIFSINTTTGALTAAGTVSVGAGTNPNYLLIHPSGKYAYTANWGNGTVSVFSVNATTGALSALGTPVATGGANAAILTMDPFGKFLFVTNFGAGSVAAFRIDANTGALSGVPGSPFTTGANPHFLEVDPTGKFVYVGNFGGYTVSAYTLDGATGALAPLPPTPEVTTRYFPVTFAINRGAAPLTLMPRFAYVANSASNDITAYSMNAADGALIKINCVAGGGAMCGAEDPTNFAAGFDPTSFAVDPIGRFAYAANEISDSITAYSVAASGVLTKIDCSMAGGGVVCDGSDPTNFETGPVPKSIAVDPTGRFAYVANWASDDVTAYRVGANGALIKINCVAGGGVVCGTINATNFAAGQGPTSFATDPTGRFAYAANSGFDAFNPGSGDVTAYLINVTTGALIKINCVAGGGIVCGTTDPTNFDAGDFPNAVIVDPTGRFAYVANHGDVNSASFVSGDVTAYRVRADGALIKINCVAGGSMVCSARDPTNFAAAAGPTAIAVEPSGRYAYVANSAAEDVTTYGIGPGGELARIDCVPGGSAVVCNGTNTVAGGVPLGVAVDPTGNFGYVANNSGAITGYRIGPDGLLTESRPFAAGRGPGSIVTTGSYQ